VTVQGRCFPRRPRDHHDGRRLQGDHQTRAAAQRNSLQDVLSGARWREAAEVAADGARVIV
jgi:hypothetical protein